MDPFRTLGIEPSFDLDLPALERRYRDVSASLHPDRYSGHPASERREALGRAIEVNEAWRILKNPIARAEALLLLLTAPSVAAPGANTDLPPDAPGKSISPPSSRQPSEPPPAPEFLMHILDLREKLTDLRAARNLAAVRALRGRVAGEEKKTAALLSQIFRTLFPQAESSDAVPAEPPVLPEPVLSRTEALATAERVLGELRYQRRFLDEANAVEDELD